jgi:diguanylate cyclase (GGDEF)-like protein/PAS domain S-box-containing protein
MKNWAIALSSGAAIFGAWAGAIAQGTHQADVAHVKVGIYQNAPKVFIDADGEPAGFWVEVLAAIAEAENWTVEYVPCEWQACLDAVEAEQLDLMLDVAYSEVRDRRFDFHQESVVSSWSVVYRYPDRPINSILDLDQRRVGVVRGSIQKPTLAERTDSFGAAPIFVEFDNFETLLQQLAVGNVDAAVVDRFVGSQAEAKYAIQPTNLLVYPSQLYFVTAEGQNAALLAAIDERLQQLLADPNSAYYQAEQQWLTSADETFLLSLRQTLLDGLIYLPIIGIVGFALWNYALRQEVKQRLQTENRLQTLTNNTPGVIFQYLLRSNGTESLLYVSSRCAEVCGIPAAAAIADVNQWWRQVHPDDGQPLRNSLLRSARTLTLWTAEWRICPSAQPEKWLQVSAQPQAHDNGDIVWDGLIFETTERKTTEIALRQSETRFQQLASNVPGILYGYRLCPDGSEDFTYLSSGFTDIYGFAPERALADSRVVWDCVHPDDVEALQLSIAQSQHTLQVWQAQYRVVLVAGQVKWLQGIARPEQQPNGDVIWDGLIIDITERMQIEAALRQSEQRFRNTAANLPGAIFQYVLHVDGTDDVTYMSAGCCDIWEVAASAAEQNAHPLWEMIHPDDYAAFTESVRQSAQTLEPWSWQWRIITPSGTLKWLAAAGRPELQANGDIVWDSLVIDISDRKQAEIALQTSESRLKTLISNLPGFVYRVANSPDYPVQFISQGVTDITGYAVADYLENGITLGEQVHRYDRARVWNQVQHALQSQETYECEYRIVTHRGGTKWVWERGQGVWDEQGQLHHLEGFITDVSDRKQAEIALQESEIRYRQVVEAQTDFILRSLPDTTITFANDALCEALGLNPNQVIGRKWSELANPEDLERHAFQQLARLTPKNPRCFVENRDVRAGGKIGWTQWLNEGVFDDIGQLVEIQSVGRDITNLKQTEEALRHSEERLRLVTENMRDLVCLHHLDGHFTYATLSSQTLLGFAPSELIGRNPYELIHPADCDLVRWELFAPALEGRTGQAIYRMRYKTAGYLWLETLSQPVFDEQGAVSQVQTTSRNVSDRVKMEQQLKHDALHDSLTALPNRDRLMQRLDWALKRSKQHPTFQFAVLFLDLDNFKVVNDSLGHLVGDELLISVAQQLLQFIRDTDIAARLGGDEFVILIEEIAHIQDAVVIAERILAALRQPFIVAEREVVITTSIGIVSGNAQYKGAVDLLRDADLAMYRAKHSGRAQYAIFDPMMHFRVTQRLHLEQDLRKALKRSELLLYYQPIVALDTLQVVGFEALVRWQHPQRGLVSPLEFIAIAEETGLIKPFGQWVLATACQQLADWQQQHPHKPLKMSVNLSVQQLQPDLISQIAAVLADSQIVSDALVLELTESMLAQNIEITQDLLTQVKQLGIRLSIDDFGTGYSSLSYLSRLPVDYLKIDRAFVNPAETNSRNQVIAESIVALSDSLGLEVIAEGIETLEQLAWLKHLGCQEGQGYLFSAPVPVEAAAELLCQTISV